MVLVSRDKLVNSIPTHMFLLTFGKRVFKGLMLLSHVHINNITECPVKFGTPEFVCLFYVVI